MKFSLSSREIPRAEPEGYPEGSGYISQYIILKDGILRFNSFNITSKRGVYFTVHSLGSIRTNC